MRLKRLCLLAFAMTMMLTFAKAMGYSVKKGYGEDYSDKHGSLHTHAVVKDFPLEGVPLYNVRVNGAYVGLYNDRNFWGGLVHFGSFEFENGHEITINISYYRPIKEFEVLPGKKLSLLSVRKTGRNSIEIKMDKADQNLTVIVNGEPKKHVLHLFCNSIDHKAPDVAGKGYHRYDDRKLHYFGPGYHDLKKLLQTDVLNIEDGWHVYIAPGAVVYGSLNLSETTKWPKISGRGMVYNDDRNKRVILAASYCNGVNVEGVLFHCHRSQGWQVALSHCRNVEFKHVKIIGTRYASTDGLDVINCQQCAFLNTFIRSNDDAIAIKGLGGKKPAESDPSRNLTFCGMQLWNDCNCAMGIGAENHCSLYENIRFMNSSILFSYDDPDYHETLDERAAMTICCIHGTYFRNISYENIDVYHCERLIAAGFQPNFWFGALPGDQTTPGGISNITYKNIRSFNNSGSHIANKIHLYGWKGGNGTPGKIVDGVTFDNVTIEGKKLESTDSPYFSECDMSTVRNITF